MKLKITAVLMLFQTVLSAQVEMPPIFNNNMVLQRNEMVSIWGRDKPNCTVIVTGSWNATAITKTDKDGKWKVKLKTPEAGGPYTVSVEGNTKVIFSDVLIGDVWICSGQSNMEMPVKGFANQPVIGSNEVILNSTNNDIRLFTVERNPSLVPTDRVFGSWLKTTPLTCKDFSAVGYFFGRKINEMTNIPIGLIHTSWGGSKIETWMDKETIAKVKKINNITEIPDDKPQSVPTLMYNGMIHPIQDFTVKGFLWYQGESNTSNASEYAKLFPAMIQQWRDQWGGKDFPFYFVQLAPYGKGQKTGYLREAQLNTMMTVKNTGMAVTLDIGDCTYIHPPEKRIVGERLAYWALAKDYGIEGFGYSGPVYEKMEKTDDGKIILHFSYCDNGLISFYRKLDGFVIAGEDKVFHLATAIVNRDRTITVSSDDVPNPVAVRYAFDGCPTATLFNIEGLPASSFRTDDWEVDEDKEN